MISGGARRAGRAGERQREGEGGGGEREAEEGVGEQGSRRSIRANPWEKYKRKIVCHNTAQHRHEVEARRVELITSLYIYVCMYIYIYIYIYTYIFIYIKLEKPVRPMSHNIRYIYIL